MSNCPSPKETEYQFAISDGDAGSKYSEFKLKDPFPEIPPALLSAEGIKKYVAATGMIYPFHPEKSHLKQASYAVTLLGRCIYWDEKGRKHDICVKEKDEFLLRGNSIAFVSLEPRFRLPYYIALRFNLKITHIHRGILLGTGPLVDPGFDGTLAVPLHNLTMNDYVLRGGDDIIWFEFTKIYIPPFDMKREPPIMERAEDYLINKFIEFRPDKNIKDINDYLHKAYHGRPIMSSLSHINQVAKDAMKRSTITTWGGAIAITALFLSILFGVYTLMFDTTTYVTSVYGENQRLIMEQRTKIRSVEKTIDSLSKKIEDLQNSISERDKKQGTDKPANPTSTRKQSSAN
jgi:deoxycytidine triphosphate deaminase